jgi:Cdc6-like AAA superfamily ATPase
LGAFGVFLLALALYYRFRISIFFTDLRRRFSGAKDSDEDARKLVDQILSSKGAFDKDKTAAIEVVNAIMRSQMTESQKRAALSKLKAIVSRSPTLKIDELLKGEEDLLNFYNDAVLTIKDKELLDKYREGDVLKEFWNIPLKDEKAAQRFLDDAIEEPRIRDALNRERDRTISDLASMGPSAAIAEKVLTSTTFLDEKDIIPLMSNQKKAFGAMKRGGSVLLRGPGGSGKTALVKSYVANLIRQGETVRFVEITRGKAAAAMGGKDSVESFSNYLEAVIKRAELAARRGEKVVIYFDEADEIFKDQVLTRTFKQAVQRLPRGVQVFGATNAYKLDSAAVSRFQEEFIPQAPADELAQSFARKLASDISGVRLDPNKDEFRLEAATLAGWIEKGKGKLSGKYEELSSRVVTERMFNSVEYQIKTLRDEAEAANRVLKDLVVRYKIRGGKLEAEVQEKEK